MSGLMMRDGTAEPISRDSCYLCSACYPDSEILAALQTVAMTLYLVPKDIVLTRVSFRCFGGIGRGKDLI